MKTGTVGTVGTHSTVGTVGIHSTVGTTVGMNVGTKVLALGGKISMHF
jgi:hypothetical protein